MSEERIKERCKREDIALKVVKGFLKKDCDEDTELYYAIQGLLDLYNKQKEEIEFFKKQELTYMAGYYNGKAHQETATAIRFESNRYEQFQKHIEELRNKNAELRDKLNEKQNEIEKQQKEIEKKDKIIKEIAKAFKQDDIRSIEEIIKYFTNKVEGDTK